MGDLVIFLTTKMEYPTVDEVDSKLKYIEKLMTSLNGEMYRLQREKEALQAIKRLHITEEEKYD